MSLIKYEPYSLLDQLQREFFRSGAFPYAREGSSDDNSNIEVSDWRPAVDIKEEKEGYVIHADTDKIEAKSKDGVLEITVPKHAKVQPRRISVSS